MSDFKELPWRTALKRKEILAKLDPSRFWYNRLLRFLKRWVNKPDQPLK